MSTLSERLRDNSGSHINGLYDREAADELDRLTAELDQHKKSAAFCDKHQPNGGQRAMCLVCAGRNLSAALSRISYLCGPPNEMQCGPYDVHCDETAVVAQVEHLTARMAELAGSMQTVRMRLEVAHRLLDIASGPSGARAAFVKIDEALKDIDKARAALGAEHG